MNTKVKGKITYTLWAMTLVPLVIFGILILPLGTHWFTKSMHAEVESGLRNVASNMITMLDAFYPGDYHLEDEGVYRLYKGDQDITEDYSLIDRVRDDTGLDITLFYQDTRILTTITDRNGQRIVGTGAPESIMNDVMNGAEAHFYKNILIYGTGYFSYYTPLFNQDGTAVGMLFVGKPAASVEAAIRKSVYPLIIADVILILIVAALTFLYTDRFSAGLMQIHSFLREVSSGNLNAKLNLTAVRRGDELSEIALSAMKMQRSLRRLVEKDALTTLSNRRTGDSRLHNIIENAAANGTPFCVALGDVDLFKNVNHTYGQECGDMVLKEISEKLLQHMRGKGFAARWSGEEFLLVFDQADIDEAYGSLEALLKDIRNMKISYQDQVIQVTMTFGITPGDTADMRELLRRADEKRQEGKTTGGNRIVR